MDEYNIKSAEDDLDAGAPETPEDVAVLYTWANVHGGKYRDFSASRREYRAQQRHRMVEAQRQAELEAARAREEAAAREMDEVRRLEEEARNDHMMRAEAEEARRRAEENIEQERQAAQRHVEVAEELKRALDEAQREMEEARRRAEEQAARYAEADARYRATARNQAIPGEIDDPYYYAGPLEPTAFAPGGGVRSSVPQRVSSEKRIAESYYRSRGGAEMAAARPEEDEHGLFSTGGRPRASSTGRPAYREVVADVPRDPGPAHFAEVRPETPEDTRERHRPDESYRTEASPAGRSYNDFPDDGYYDGLPVRHERTSDPTAPNSAPSNVYLAPRTQQAPPPPPRSRDDSGERRTVRVEEQADPAPGNTHVLDTTRARRRESAADVNARTARRPRESGVMPSFAAQNEVRPAPREIEDREREKSQRRDEATVPRSFAPPVPPPPVPMRDGRAVAEERPEWLLRDARRAAPAEPMAEERLTRLRESGQENEGHRDERVVADRQTERSRLTDSQMIPASDGGFNLRPLPDRSAAPLEPLRDESSRRESLPPPREAMTPLRESPPARPPRESSPLMRESLPARRDADGLGRERNPYENESEPRIPAVRADDRAARAEDRVVRSDDRVERQERVPPPAASGDPLPARPLAERRRTDRSSGDRTVRDLRAPQSEFERRERRVRPEESARSEGRSHSPHPADTLQQSRERVAARWFALKGLMGNSGETQAETAVPRTSSREMPLPILAVVSLSGGVGKTSLVATLGRALSSLGERVLLADATPHGLLPYYFGARELRPDVVRTFSPPPGSKDAAVYMVNYEADRLAGDEAGQIALVEEIGRHGKGAQRLLMDLNAMSAWLARRMAAMNGTILVPVAPDMNSVLGIKSVERFFSGLQDEDGRPVQPQYILNQFDASLPLHLDVREVLRQQLGDRLLPVMIRRSPSVSEALAEGMTVMDYAPESPVTEDYAQLAEWVRRRSAPAQTAMRSTRWSER